MAATHLPLPIHWTPILALFAAKVASFNLDVSSPRILSGPQGSMFGFTVAQNAGSKQILVGAPRAGTQQPGLRQPGAVYECPPDGRAACLQLVFDTRGNRDIWNGTHRIPIENKSDQWFGSTLVVSADGGVVLACAPRYMYFKLGTLREPVGACYVKGSQPGAIKVSPCEKEVDFVDEPDQYARKSKAQYGISAAISRGGGKMAVGAVGVYTWQGQIFFHDTSNPMSSRITAPNSVEDYSYMGYSLAAGHFNEDDIEDYVVGIPRAENLKGMVAAFTSTGARLFSVPGRQMGEYFGYSLAVGSFTGNGYDDIAVGAPLHSPAGGVYEAGRVYVFYQTQEHSVGPTATILSGDQRAGARFGLAVATLGDVNLDGYDDVAVGAPYDGDDKNGALYVFYGSEAGMRSKASQVVYPSTLGGPFSTFGFSISGGSDMDGNGYPDVVVGAYQSNAAVYLRTRPVVKVGVTMAITPALIDLQAADCELVDSRGRSFTAVCVKVKTCFKYSGDHEFQSIVLEVSWQLDPRGNSPSRMFYTGGNSRETTKRDTLAVERNTQRCTSHSAFVEPTIRDKQSSLTVKMTYDLLPRRLQPGSLDLVLDGLLQHQATALAHIRAECGEDDVCVPDLQLTAKSLTKEYILGTKDSPLAISLQVVNAGEDAFLAQLVVSLPPGTSYINILNNSAMSAVKCLASSDGSGVLCDVGNPLHPGQTVVVVLQVSALDYTESSAIQFDIQANSSNTEAAGTTRDNYGTVRIPIKAKVVLRVSGVSEPEQISYNSSMPGDVITEEDIGPKVVHLYEVRNLGPSTTREAVVTIFWPAFLERGTDLLYLTALPQVVNRPGRCTAEGVNRRNITLGSSRRRRSTQQDEDIADNLLGGDTGDSQPTMKLICTSVDPNCIRIHCQTGVLRQDESVFIKVGSRVWIRSLIGLPVRALIVVSYATAEGTTGLPGGEVARGSSQVGTYLAASGARMEKGALPPWVVAVSALSGIVFLLIIMALLYKCGFFKRTRPGNVNAAKNSSADLTTTDPGNTEAAE